jgi:tRNA A-37 threonylcarbamoyl transferase component Bud32
MPFLITNPDYRDFLERQGLTTCDDFLSLQGIVVGGHPDRHVAHVTVGAGPSAIRAFLKREHRVAWKERMANAFCGFGFVSKSVREARMLDSASRAGIACAEWIAAGEDARGRAFVLVRDLADAVDLRAHLAGLSSRPAERRRFCRSLGVALAKMHLAGFDHPDLYSKHVLVRSDGSSHFVDWQRSQRSRSLEARRRCQNLAALHATLGDSLASPRDRLACLRSYLRFQSSTPLSERCAAMRRTIVSQAERLMRRRRVRELRHQPAVSQVQQLVWLDGEALCVTPHFLATLGGQLPDYLALSKAPRRRGSSSRPDGSELSSTSLELPRGDRGLLMRRHCKRPLARLWAWVRRCRLGSPELNTAAIIFRLERFGLSGPRLLAVGQRHQFPWSTSSFSLVQLPPKTTSLLEWLKGRSGRPGWTAERKQRWRVLRETASVLRTINDAGYSISDWEGALADLPKIAGSALFCVEQGANGVPKVVLGRVTELRRCRRDGSLSAPDQVGAVSNALAAMFVSKNDHLRFLLAYLGLKRLTPEAKQLAWLVMRKRRSLPGPVDACAAYAGERSSLQHRGDHLAFTGAQVAPFGRAARAEGLV